MTNHEYPQESGYQPDQAYEHLDYITGAVAEATAHGYTETPEILAAEFATLIRWTKRLIEDQPTPESPPSLPPSLLALWEEEDRRNGTPPPPSPEAPQ